MRLTSVAQVSSTVAGWLTMQGRLRLAVERPDVAVDLFRVIYLADALGFKGDSLFGRCGNYGTHTGHIAGLDYHAERLGLQILLVNAGDALLVSER